MMKLTISAHAHSDAFLQTTVLASVAINPQNRTLLIFRAWPVLNFLLDASSEETLRRNTIFYVTILFLSRTLTKFFTIIIVITTSIIIHYSCHCTIIFTIKLMIRT